MRVLKGLLLFLFLLAIASGALYGLYRLFNVFIIYLGTVNTDLGIAIVSLAGTAIVTVISIVLGKIWEQGVKIKEELRERKRPLYETFIQQWFVAMFAMPEAPEQQGIQLVEAFRSFTPKLMVWGGPKVIKTWTEVRLHDWSSGSYKDGFQKFEIFIKAIRDELGASNRTLNEGDLLRLFINDYNATVVSTSNQDSPKMELP